MLDMIEFAWNEALGNLLQVGLTASAAALVLLLLRRVMKKRYPARAVCVVWAILAVRLLIPVQLTLPDPPVQVTPRTTYISNFTLDAETIERAELPVYEREGAVATQNWVSNDEAQALREAAGGPGAFLSFDWGRILCLLWIVGIALFALWQVLPLSAVPACARKEQLSGRARDAAARVRGAEAVARHQTEHPAARHARGGLPDAGGVYQTRAVTCRMRRCTSRRPGLSSGTS